MKVAVIGAGPSGLFFMYHIEKLKRNEEVNSDVEVVCFEKQGQIGGTWNYDWQTGKN